MQTPTRIALLALPLTLLSFGAVYGGLSFATARDRDAETITTIAGEPLTLDAGEASKAGAHDTKAGATAVATPARVAREAERAERAATTESTERAESTETAETADTVEAPARRAAPERRDARRRSTPDLREVTAAVRRITARCAHGAAFEGELYVTFMGNHGRVGTLELRGGDAAIGRCIEREAFTLRVAPFDSTSFVARIPIRPESPPVDRRPRDRRVAETPLPILPSPEETDRAFARTHRALATCAGGQGGEVQIAATLAGATGEPTMVVVLPPWGGTEQGACMERAITERVRVRPFESRSHVVTARLSL